jgi:hypothetical protein
MCIFARLQGLKKASTKKVVEVGWVLQTESASFIWDAPRPVSRPESVPPQTSKSVMFCPAVVDHEARLFEITCPVELRLGFAFTEQGQPVLIDRMGDQSPVRRRHLNDMIAIVPQKEWRHPKRPIIQIITPYTFLADDPVYMTQLPPFLHYRDPALPGLMIGGRMPIDVWPRVLMWAFEWFDTSKDLILRRGEPWFYTRFELPNPSQRVRLVEAQLTPELKQYFNGLNGVANYVKQTFSLFSIARQRRPKQLLVKVSR